MERQYVKSVATIDNPEFINVSSISPLISKCEIKVFYIGQNRNGSFITKEVANKMAETLRGVPIAGAYSECKKDFTDHGDRMIIDDEGVKFEKLTKPYGFVAPDSKIWFQFFEDTDEFGNVQIREYLMTEGYLWTELYNEAKTALIEGRPQSMELDENSLSGYWSELDNSGLEFFIINDATFSQLCILGEDVEPCFEGSEIKSTFSKNDNFAKSLFTMMEEFKDILHNKGGYSLENEEPVISDVEDIVIETENSNPIEIDEIEDVINTIEEDEVVETAEVETSISEESEEVLDVSNSQFAEKTEVEDMEDYKSKYEALLEEFEEYKKRCHSLEAERDTLAAFKSEIEDKQKDEMIESFYMLSEEDKKDVILNKSNYSLEDIKAKLSIICVDKKVDFSLGSKVEKEIEKPIMTFNVQEEIHNDIPAWLKAVDKIQEDRI